MKIKTTLLSLSCMISAAGYAAAPQAIWLNNTDSFFDAGYFSVDSNWESGSAPVSGTSHLVLNNSVLAANVGGDGLWIDTGSAYTAVGITVNAINFLVTRDGTESLIIGSEGLTLLDGTSVEFALPTLSSSTSTWRLGANSILSLATNLDITAGVLTIDMGVGATVNFNMAQTIATWDGTIEFTGAISETSISVAGTSLTQQNIEQIKINGSAVELVGGYLIATAVPEPATYAALFALGALAMVIYRRRKS